MYSQSLINFCSKAFSQEFIKKTIIRNSFCIEVFSRQLPDTSQNMLNISA
jgi:hypothetical protein